MLLAGLRARLRSNPLAQTIYRYTKWYLRLQFETAPWSIALETTAACNRTCGYCPVSIHTRRGEMPRSLFEKIIDDLVEIDFSRTLSFHFYNEPLMDERLPELVAYARARLPRCVLDLSTNGDYLTSTMAEALFRAGVDAMHISLHSATAEKHVRGVLDVVEPAMRSRMSVISMFDRESHGEFLYNRIEMAEAPTASESRTSYGRGCSNVSSLMIDYQGETGLCCNDFFAVNGHGNLRETRVATLWRESRPVRKRIFLGRFDKPICKICNVGAAAQ